VLSGALESGFDLVDVEYAGGAGRDLMGFEKDRVIVSLHDLSGIPRGLQRLLAGMLDTGARYVKIVATAADSRDAVGLLNFQRRHADGILSIIAMGEAGLATRVLSPYFGAALSYGALDPGRTTAAGQIPAWDLVDVYGIGARRNVERIFALFGGIVSHSLSPAIHNANFRAGGDDALYVPIALRSMLREFDPLVAAFDSFGVPLKGASVTIPFKEEAASIAVFRGESVANTLVRSGDAYIASNTDRMALASFTPLGIPGSQALVLGAGGLARAAIDVLIARRFDVHVWNHEPVRAHELAEETGCSFLANLVPSPAPFSVIVNATPIGMKADDGLPCPEEFVSPDVVVIDAPYRPGGTRLSNHAREIGATLFDGYALLLTQAAKQAELFTGRVTTPASLVARLPERYQGHFAEVVS
jgi:3-dehydroquinate dehydratase/shikimate dehydrogenase